MTLMMSGFSQITDFAESLLYKLWSLKDLDRYNLWLPVFSMLVSKGPTKDGFYGIMGIVVLLELD